MTYWFHLNVYKALSIQIYKVGEEAWIGDITAWFGACQRVSMANDKETGWS